VGRQDIFNHIREVWGGKSNPDSIILYGHRRMGKSSILRNLPHYAPAGSLLVYVDLKGQTAFAESTSHLLRGLAEETVWAAQERGLACEEPAAEAYHTPPEAALAFRRLLRRVLVALPPESSLILALDEFEAIDKAVADDKIGPEIYDYLRDLSQQPRVVLVFAGLHTLDEMSRDYRQAFFGSYINLRVSYLSQKAAERLVMRPTPDFPLNYAPEVVQRIIAETHGQPLLLQRLCQELVNQLNHELFDLDLDREARILPADLDAVLTDDFVRSETRYFEGIWSDQVAANPAVAALLETLARQGPSHSEKLVARTDLSPQQVTAALDYLQCRDLVDDRERIWDLRIPLMRRWLQLRGGNSE
jgi:hypothetical protein